MVNKKYPIEIQILTPLSIGIGGENEWAKGVDFVQKDGNVYILDMQKIVEFGIDIERLSNLFVERDSDGIVRSLAGKMDKLSRKVFSFRVSSDNPIKTTLKNELYDTPLIAGSSLKGAIRSFLFSYLKGDESGKDAEKKVFGSLKDGEEFGRFIKISDVEFTDTHLYNSKIFNLRKVGEEWTGGWKHEMRKTTGTFNPSGFNTIYECIVPGSKGVGAIMFSETTFDLFEKNRKFNMPYSTEKGNLIHSDIKELCSIINDHTRLYLEKEKEFFETFQADKSDEIITSIDNLLDKIPADNSYCILKMSAGSGFHSITGDWQYDDFVNTGEWEALNRNAGKHKYKSRKIVLDNGHFNLMGFVLIRPISDQAYNAAIDNLMAVHQAIMQNHLEELKQLQQEKEAIILRKKEVEVKYHQLIKEALEAEEHDNFVLAVEKATEAGSLSLGQNDHDVILNRLRIKALEQKDEADRKKKEAELLAAQEKKVSGGIAALLNEKYELGPNAGNYKVSSFKVCFQKIESWMKAAKVTQLADEQKQQMIETVERLISNPDKKEAKEINNRNSKLWNKLFELLGKDLCNKLK